MQKGSVVVFHPDGKIRTFPASSDEEIRQVLQDHVSMSCGSFNTHGCYHVKMQNDVYAHFGQVGEQNLQVQGLPFAKFDAMVVFGPVIFSNMKLPLHIDQSKNVYVPLTEKERMTNFFLRADHRQAFLWKTYFLKFKVLK